MINRVSVKLYVCKHTQQQSRVICVDTEVNSIFLRIISGSRKRPAIRIALRNAKVIVYVKLFAKSWLTRQMVLPHIWVCGISTARPFDATLDNVAANISISVPLVSSKPRMDSRRMGVILKPLVGFWVVA